MELLEQLLNPYLSIDDFLAFFHSKKPFAAPERAQPFCNLLSWPILEDIFRKRGDDTWPVRQGSISTQFTNDKGRLNPGLARAAFAQGHTLVVRHSEKAHASLNLIAGQFENFFRQPVDLQIYLTPAEEEGFDWHYDVEEVFVIQTHGMKEFRLLENTVTAKPLPLLSKENQLFAQEKKNPEIRCLLKAGDWLYIPAGYWHKARAITDSFHISIGVANSATATDSKSARAVAPFFG
jgi:50S ribosomal protein L16 3-hydroxylase